MLPSGEPANTVHPLTTLSLTLSCLFAVPVSASSDPQVPCTNQHGGDRLEGAQICDLVHKRWGYAARRQSNGVCRHQRN